MKEFKETIKTNWPVILILGLVSGIFAFMLWFNSVTI